MLLLSIILNGEYKTATKAIKKQAATIHNIIVSFC